MKHLLTLLAAAGTLLPLSALAGDERNYLAPTRHWFTDVQTHFDSTNDNSIGTTAADTATERAIVKAAQQTWQDVACTDVTFVDATVYSGTGEPSTNFTWGNDGISATVFEDNNCSPGVLAFNFPFYISNTEVVNGRTWQQIDETDTSFCADIDFGTPAEIDSPACVGQFDMQGIALHEYGHGIGYAHTCESDEPCGDPELRGAVMYWAVGSCDGAQRTPNNYDLETHSISYGLGAGSSFSVLGGEGGLPLDVTFAPLVIASASVTSVTWDFGDGSLPETTTGGASHTYTVEGRFSVGAEITANAAACGGDFTQTVRKTDVVIACNELEPAFHYDKDGKTVKFYSDTLGAAAGCLQTLNWDFGDGATANVKNPVHKYPTGGNYTVTLTASGPAGTSDPLTKTVKVGGGGGGLFGCSLDGSEAPSTNTAAAAGALGIAVLMSLATAARRRID